MDFSFFKLAHGVMCWKWSSHVRSGLFHCSVSVMSCNRFFRWTWPSGQSLGLQWRWSDSRWGGTQWQHHGHPDKSRKPVHRQRECGRSHLEMEVPIRFVKHAGSFQPPPCTEHSPAQDQVWRTPAPVLISHIYFCSVVKILYLEVSPSLYTIHFTILNCMLKLNYVIEKNLSRI